MSQFIPRSNRFEWRPEFGKFYSIESFYGKEFVDKMDLTTSFAEEISMSMFKHLHPTEGVHKNRGDFLLYDPVMYFDQKTCEVEKYLDGMNGIFYHVKYSNVLSKIFVQLILREIDNIIYDIKEYGYWNEDKHSRLMYMRYKTEITFEDMCFINEVVLTSERNLKSFCGKNKMSFIHFANYLCTHNVRKFANLLIFHEPVNYEQMIKWNIEKIGDTQINYTTYNKHKKYIVTPINVLTSNFFIDYIGFGGFKCYVQESEKLYGNPPDTIQHLLDEIDYCFSLMIGCNEFKEVHKKLPWNCHYTVPNWSESYCVNPNKLLKEHESDLY
jgi:hypothetical protein